MTFCKSKKRSSSGQVECRVTGGGALQYIFGIPSLKSTVFAPQDHSLTAGLKKIPGVPLMYIIMNTIVLDKPYQASLDHVRAVQLGELVSPSQQQTLRSLKEEQGIAQNDGEQRGKKRKRKRSNPNPLSCMKKKKKAGPTPPKRKAEEGEGEKKKRVRHKKRRTEGGDASAPAVA